MTAGESHPQRTADAVLEESFLQVRAKLLEIGATLDRLDRCGGAGELSGANSQKRALLDQAVEIVRSEQPDRAERLQQLFSREYQQDWRQKFGIGSD